jgi:uncharacterized membrane protein YhaH (DUF805 family)
MNPLLRPWRQVFDFKGRATRTEYLLFHVSILIGVVALGFVVELLDQAGLMPPEGGGGTQVQELAGGIFGVVFFGMFVILLIGHFAIGVRRLHDHGDPGVKYLLTFIPFIGWIFYLMMIFSRGDDYENEYGYDPRNPNAEPENLGEVFS